MGLDFDAVEYCKNVKQKHSQPPFACPVQDCGRSYKTIIGLQYHLLKYDHDNPQPLTPVMMPSRKKSRIRGGPHSSTPKSKGGDDSQCGTNAVGKHQAANPESLVTYNEDTDTVQFNFDGKSVRLAADDPLPFIDDNEFSELLKRGCIINADDPPIEENAAWARVEVPVANCVKLENYNVPDAPPRPLAYYRFIEKTVEELDGEIEYDVDEEDCAWLEHMNEQRESNGLNTVTIDTMELLMDRLEKESYFQAAANGTAMGVEVDENAVCCICLDGECQNTNVILFCDMCNLAVHQDCYGVPYIPEGQWLCRRCLQSPSTPVNCVLCPNTGGAFKQTDRGQWAHVVCALWIPEVRFANTVFLEPIDSIETIPMARWRLTCYVCKEKGLGACIQCQRNNCYAAFHVTCAQQAGLYMTMDMKEGHNNSSCHVQKYAYCHAHTPADAKLRPNQTDFEDTRQKMKEARKALAKKRSTAPVVLIPTIPPERVQEISSMVHMQKKKDFLDRLIAYWTLKRQYRNGVPLLRRLQSQGNNHGVIHRNGIEGSPDTNELYRQLKYWQCLRQDLERARLLCELVRKREKLKKAEVLFSEKVVMLQLNPLEWVLTKLLDMLEAKDTSEIFREPVDTEEVPDYLDIVTHPMDLGTMRKKLELGQYATIDQLETDFDLMIQNCLAYNNKDTVFYRAGIRMRDQAAPLFVQVRKNLEREGLLIETTANHIDHVEQEVEDELRKLLAAKPSEEIVQKLLILADKSQVLKNPTYRTKKIKQIRLEITRMRKAMQRAKTAARNSSFNAQSQSENDEDSMEHMDAAINHTVSDSTIHEHVTPKRARKPLPALAMDIDEDDTMEDDSKETTNAIETPPCSPVKSLNNSASPVGVNRRTAVLFTRKAQAALKRPSESAHAIKEEHNTSTSTGAPLTANSGTPAAASLITPNSNNNNGGNVATGGNLASTPFNLNNKVNNSNNHLSTHGAINSSSAAGQTTGKSPKRNAKHKRLSEMRNSSSMSPKKSPNPALASATVSSASNSLVAGATTANTLSTKTSTSNLSYDRKLPESFRFYRANNERDNSDSEDEDMSDISGSPCSSCSGFSVSGSGSEYDSSDDDEEDDTDGIGVIGGRSKHHHHHHHQQSQQQHPQQQQPKQRQLQETEDDEEEEGEEDDDDDDDEDDGEEEEEDDGEDENIESQDNTNLTNAAGGNGEAMSCSDNSDDSLSNSDMKTEVSTASDQQQQQPKHVKRITRRTPTPAEKRPARAKQKRSNHVNAATPPPPTTITPTKSNSKVKRTPANAQLNTTNNNQPPIPTAMATRTSTPLAKMINSKKRKGTLASAALQTATASEAPATTPQTFTTNNNKAKINNVHRRKSMTASPAPPVTQGATKLTTADKTQPSAISDNLVKPPLEPLQLVWAKCRGYPWYPALILDPKTPKGFVYNGVPLPAPPPDVLALRKNYTEDELFLVLFFDVKRTWQWLPANKLEILGIDKGHDQQKLIESRKPTERKAVKKAYQDALHYQSQVSDLEGQGPDPIM